MIELAIVGCGGHANWHAGLIKGMPDVTVSALVDIDRTHAEAYRTKYFPDATIYEDFNAFLKQRPKSITGVLIATPHTLHYSQCKAALTAGLHVLCEKPMVTASAHAYDLWKTVQQTGRQLSIAFQAPHSAEFQYLRSMRAAGTLGTPQIIQGWLAQGWLKASAGTWRQDPALSGGGQMYDSGAHVLNAMMWLMDEPVVEVTCLYDRVGSAVDINGVAILRFLSGALGSVAIGGNSPGWNVRISLQTDRLQVVTGPHGGFLEISGQRYPHVPTSDVPAAFTPIGNFVRTLAGQETLQSPVRYGVLLSALMDALYESAAQQRPVKVEPVPEKLP
ncbi:MAG: putative dehydrogenase [Phycisphaerales bacterium]|nr:putative dehydrogenase [Phycisphaerales bacterium]